MSGVAATSGIDIGSIIADTYRVTRMLGRGGMGAVWEAEHTRLPGKRVAIKVLHADVATDQDSVARFRREAEIASKLGHPNIVGVHDFNTLPGGKPYLILDFLEGESLDARLERGPIPLEEALVIVRQVGSALRAAHREQVIHRDLKPQNVFMAIVGPDSDEVVAKVLDFGISKIRGSQTVQTQDSTILGTPQYMAPEQAVGQHDAVDARTDVFALGAMVYEMLAGKPAFFGQTIPEVVFKVVYEEPKPLGELVPGLPESIVTTVHRALSKQQDDRHSSIEELVQALTGEPLTTARRRRKSLVPQGMKDSSEDAMAATVGSGPHEPMLGTADTIDSARLASPVVPGADAEQTVGARPAHMSEPASPPPIEAQTASTKSGSRTALIVVLALIAGFGIAAVVAWQMGMFGGTQVADGAAAGPAADTPDTQNTGEPAAAVAADAGELEDQPAAPATDDNGDVDSPPKTDRDSAAASNSDKDRESANRSDKDRESAKNSHTPKRNADETRPKRTDEPDSAADKAAEAGKREQDDPAAPAARADLAAAKTALRDGNTRNARRLADRALRNGAGARARLIKAKAYCMEQDLGNARANYRALSARSKKSVARFCANHGIELE